MLSANSVVNCRFPLFGKRHKANKILYAKGNDMNIVLIVVVAAIIGFAVGRMKSLARFNRRRAWRDTEYN